MKKFDDEAIKALEDSRFNCLHAPDPEHEKKLRAARDQAALAGELSMAALAAMSALIHSGVGGDPATVAERAWALAEAMVAERGKRIPDAFVAFGGLSARVY